MRALNAENQPLQSLVGGSLIKPGQAVTQAFAQFTKQTGQGGVFGIAALNFDMPPVEGLGFVGLDGFGRLLLFGLLVAGRLVFSLQLLVSRRLAVSLRFVFFLHCRQSSRLLLGVEHQGTTQRGADERSNHEPSHHC